MAAVSSLLPSPTAPPARLGHLTSIHGRPEHISTSPFNVAVPVVDSVETLPADCPIALAAMIRQPAAAAAASTWSIQARDGIALTTAAPRRAGRSWRRTG